MRRETPVSRTLRDTEQILERAADRLLMMSVRETGYGDHPFHTVRWETRVAAREGADCDAYDIEPPRCDSGQWADVARVLSTKLRLRPIDRVMVLYLAEGRSPQQVREALGLPPRALRYLMRRLIRAARSFGLTVDDLRQHPSDVEQAFQEQITITAYRDERHCPEGREACRRYGKCTRRWYLRNVE
jgi:hypothetical protein